jgi:hypothetical protein
MRVEAFRAFAADVQNGGYPQRTHEIHANEAVTEALEKAART